MVRKGEELEKGEETAQEEGDTSECVGIGMDFPR